MNSNNRSMECGFTLVEVLIASAILMGSLGVLMQLFGSGLERMHKAGSLSHNILVERQVVSELQSINPALQSSGSGVFEGVSYRWSAEKVSKFRVVRMSGEVANKKTALFSISVDLLLHGSSTSSFKLELIGWK